MPRRKPGTLLPIELEILGAALGLRRAGEAGFHGFGLAQTMREQRGSRALTGHGTLYKALGRLEDRGLLRSRWEEAAAADADADGEGEGESPRDCSFPCCSILLLALRDGDGDGDGGDTGNRM